MINHRKETVEQFREALITNQAASSVEARGWQIDCHNAKGGVASRLAVRQRGSFVTQLALTPTTSREANPISLLYCDDDVTKSKLPASHAMAPVGPAPKTVGGQHGFLRWIDYEKNVVSGANTLALTAGGWPPRAMRHFELKPDALTTTTSVLNYKNKSVGLSLGHHDYYSVAENDIPSIRVNGEPLDEQLRQEGALAATLRGEAQFWPAFAGSAEISFPTEAGIRTLQVDARAKNAHEELPPESLGMLFWHRPGTDSLCIEPVAGVAHKEDGSLAANGIVVAAGSYAMIATTIRLVS